MSAREYARREANRRDSRNNTTYYLYVLACGARRKIGITNDLEGRKRRLELSAGRRMKLLASWKYDRRYDALDRELELHRRFADFRLIGEWFRARPVDEWLQETPQRPGPNSPTCVDLG